MRQGFTRLDRYGIVDERDMRNAFEAVAGYVGALPKTRKVVALAERITPKETPKRR